MSGAVQRGDRRGQRRRQTPNVTLRNANVREGWDPALSALQLLRLKFVLFWEGFPLSFRSKFSKPIWSKLGFCPALMSPAR